MSLQNITGYSMLYKDKDLHVNKTWKHGGITNWYTCHIFNENVDGVEVNCPFIPDPDPRIENAQFIAVNELSFVADNDGQGFKEFVVEVMLSEKFFKQFEVVLNKLIAATNNDGITSECNTKNGTEIIRIYVLDKANVTFPQTFAPIPDIPDIENTIGISNITTEPTDKDDGIPLWAIVLISILLFICILVGIYYFTVRLKNKRDDGYEPVTANNAM